MRVGPCSLQCKHRSPASATRSTYAVALAVASTPIGYSWRGMSLLPRPIPALSPASSFSLLVPVCVYTAWPSLYTMKHGVERICSLSLKRVLVWRLALPNSLTQIDCAHRHTHVDVRSQLAHCMLEPSPRHAHQAAWCHTSISLSRCRLSAHVIACCRHLNFPCVRNMMPYATERHRATLPLSVLRDGPLPLRDCAKRPCVRASACLECVTMLRVCTPHRVLVVLCEPLCGSLHALARPAPCQRTEQHHSLAGGLGVGQNLIKLL